MNSNNAKVALRGEPEENTHPRAPTQAWHALPLEQVLAEFNSTPDGLSSEEAARRLQQYGRNELREAKPISPWAIFLSQFKSLLILILIAAAVISGALGEWVDCVAILAIVILNAVIGFYQEFNAEKSIAALKKMTAPQAKVHRDGRVISVRASDIVPGDVLEIEPGDLVAADARLIEASSVRCVESALTGESEAVSKRASVLVKVETPLGDRENVIFMGTSIAAGTGRAVVVATGMSTEIGKIAGLIEEASVGETTPLQGKLQSFGRVLVWASLAIVAVLFVLGLLRGMEFLELFMTSVSLAVAAVPEGLPAVVTVALALGVTRMARRRALVRKLPSVETLGSTTVICTDKTGTLTVGEMTVRELYVAGETFRVTGEGYAPEGKILFGENNSTPAQIKHLTQLGTSLVACNNAHLAHDDGQWKVVGDPTEGAMLAAGLKIGVKTNEVERSLPKAREIPFDSDRKRRTVIRNLSSGDQRAFINGAPDVLLQLCTHLYSLDGVRRMTEQDRKMIADQNSAMAHRALRVLGAAYRDFRRGEAEHLNAEEIEQDLTFVGLTGMYDPPRAEAKEAVARCHEAGIKVVMITGDHPRTAQTIAKDLGIASSDNGVLSGMELDRISDDELRRRALHTAVYARVTAEHKLRIVRAWKANGAVVAMTGDGVNDAPAIKGADIGIGMGRTGTEVTKQASDMIVTDDNFASIVAAVEEGRGIYENIRKTLQYLLAGNCGELLLITACVLLGLPMPLLPIHLLWINLVTDGFPALCLATDPIDKDVMRHAPRRSEDKITSGGFVGMLLLTGILTAGVSLTVFLYALQHSNLEMARTHAFAVLVFAELLRSFGARSTTKPIWKLNLFSNKNLVIVVMLSLAVQIFSHYNEAFARFLKTSTLPVSECLMLIGLGFVPLLTMEILKPAGTRGKRFHQMKPDNI